MKLKVIVIIMITPYNVIAPSLTGASPSLQGPPHQWFRLLLYMLYTSSHILEIVLDNFRCCIRPDKTPKECILAVDPCWKWSDYLHNHAHSYNNGSKTLSYSPIISWRHHVRGPFGGLAIMQFNCTVHKLIARLPLMVKYRGINSGI